MSPRSYTPPPSKDYSFNLGLVHRVFLNNTDQIKQGEENNSYQMIELKALNSTMKTVQKKISARPLLRGVNDSITRGDLVLFTTIKEKSYYLGPLNTFNEPNYSSAPFYKKLLEGRDGNIENASLINNYGYGEKFPYKKIKKAQKDKNIELDFFSDEQYDFCKVSDLTLEGRHGNFIRLGSRGIFPNLSIDNNSTGASENINIGSTISMLSNGSISQNFNINENLFRLSVDPILQDGEEVNLFALNKGNDGDESSFNYRFGYEDPKVVEKNDKDQMIIFSDRITFDARNPLGGDFTVSAKNNINFGAGKNFTLNNSGYSVINSNNIYLGDVNKTKDEPMVLGEQLRIILEQIVNILSNAHAFVQGVPIPLVDNVGAPLKKSKLVGSLKSLEELLQELTIREQEDGVYQNGNTAFLSRHHYIEQNRS